jgi:hypothetical protein
MSKGFTPAAPEEVAMKTLHKRCAGLDVHKSRTSWALADAAC